MNQIITLGVMLLAMGVVLVFTEWAVDTWYDRMDRRNYRRRTNPRNIEKTTQDALELELQQFLIDEELKEKARNRMEHPSNYSKKTGGGLDDETKEILAKLTNPQRQGNQYWWGND